MGLFSKKIPTGPDIINSEDEVLGNLDELQRNRVAVTVQVKGQKWRSSIYSLDLKKKIMRIQDVEGMESCNKMEVQCVFTLDSLLYAFPSRIFYTEGKPNLEIPEYLEMKKQRKNPRISFSPRENINVSALEGLGAGVGITGKAIDLTKEAITIMIERAIMLQNEKQVSPHMGLLKIGGELMIVKINKLPGCPVIQCSGVVLRLSRHGDWQLVIRLTGVPANLQAAIDTLIQDRYMEPKAVRRSYKKRLQMDKEREEREKTTQEKAILEYTGNGIKEGVREKPVEPEISFVPRGKVTRFIKDESLLKEEPQLLSSQPGKITETTSETITETTTGATNETTMESLTGLERVSQVDEEEEPGITLPTFEEIKIPGQEERASQQLPMIISLGEELDKELSFLEDVEEFQWEHVSSPLQIIKALNRHKTAFLMCTVTFKGQSMLEYLEKIAPMGVLKEVEIILYSQERLSPKDLIKCRMLGIQDVFHLPLDDPGLVLDLINTPGSSQL